MGNLREDGFRRLLARQCGVYPDSTASDLAASCPDGINDRREEKVRGASRVTVADSLELQKPASPQDVLLPAFTDVTEGSDRVPILRAPGTGLRYMGSKDSDLPNLVPASGVRGTVQLLRC